MSFADSLAAATQAAVCGWLQNGGNQALTTAIIGGATVPGGQLPALAAGLGLLAMNGGCSYNPGAATSDGSWSGSICTQVGGITYLGFTGTTPGTPRTNLKVLDIGIRTGWAGWPTTQRNGIRYTYTTNGVTSAPVETSISPSDDWIFTPGSGCTSTGAPGLPTGGNQPYTYTDPTTRCTYVVEHLAWDIGGDGVVAPVVKISAGPASLASGGVIGGCNFSPVVYRGPGGGGGGGGGIHFPWAPGPDVDGEPWWVPLLRGAAGGAAGAVVSRLLDEIFKEMAPADTYRLVSVCEQDAQGEPVSQERRVDLPAAPILNGIVKRLDAMEVLMQGLKDFKQPTCSRPRPQGELVTVNFISPTKPPGSSAYLRKQLRYRDSAGVPEVDHVAHWEQFEWQAGPAIVTSKGARWGVVQVWAADPEEGRRVIRHAASIAGVDLSGPEHAWENSTPRSARYGRSGRMAVERDSDGTACVSKRVGASGQPSWMLSP